MYAPTKSTVDGFGFYGRLPTAVMSAGIQIWQGLTRVSHFIAAKKKKASYERTKDPAMYPIDRAVGNILEWSPIFLGLFWVSMVITNGATVKAGWLYVAARALYPVMAVNKGIGTVGAKAPILIATVPGYVALGMMTTPAIKALFL